MIDTAQIKHRLETWKAMAERRSDPENEGLCHNPLCDQEEWPSEMIGHQCDCGGYIWHKDEYTEEEVNND